MNGRTRFASWDANTGGKSSGMTCLLRELRIALERIVDILSLKRRVPTFTLDCTDAYHQAPELDDVVVEPPEEYLNRLRAHTFGGSCRNNCRVDTKLVNVGSIIFHVCVGGQAGFHEVCERTAVLLESRPSSRNGGAHG